MTFKAIDTADMHKQLAQEPPSQNLAFHNIMGADTAAVQKVGWKGQTPPGVTVGSDAPPVTYAPTNTYRPTNTFTPTNNFTPTNTDTFKPTNTFSPQVTTRASAEQQQHQQQHQSTRVTDTATGGNARAQGGTATNDGGNVSIKSGPYFGGGGSPGSAPCAYSFALPLVGGGVTIPADSCPVDPAAMAHAGVGALQAATEAYRTMGSEPDGTAQAGEHYVATHAAEAGVRALRAALPKDVRDMPVDRAP